MAQENFRLKRNEEGQVLIHQQKQLQPEERAVVSMYAAHTRGWRLGLMKCDKIHIALTACTLVCYNLGYKEVVGVTQVSDWIQGFENTARFSSATFVLKKKIEINKLHRQNNQGTTTLP
jgi:hypothetical protein